MSNSETDTATFIKIRTCYGDEYLVNKNHIVSVNRDGNITRVCLVTGQKLFTWREITL